MDILHDCRVAHASYAKCIHVRLSQTSRSSKYPKNAIVVKVCSVPYRKTNYGVPLAQQMVVQGHPCGGLSSYMKSAFRSIKLQDSGYTLGAQLRHLSLPQEKGSIPLQGKYLSTRARVEAHYCTLSLPFENPFQ